MTPSAPILVTTVPDQKFDVGHALRWVRATHGKGVLSQTGALLGLALRRKFLPKEYFLYGFYRPTLGPKDIRAYLSGPESARLNAALTPDGSRNKASMIVDKVMSLYIFKSLGLAVPKIGAHFSDFVRIPEPETLTTAEGIVAFLASPGALPCFGKPVHGSRGFGGLSILMGDASELLLGDGRTVSTRAVAEEIVRTYPEGFVFHELLLNAPELAALVGPTLATVRIVTLQTGAGPQMLYCVLRIPAPGAMVDAAIAGRSMTAHVDVSDGRILRAQDMFRLPERALTHHPVTGAEFPGFVLPHWETCKAIVHRAHAAFGFFGVLGWDIALTPLGPVMNEVNTNPMHFMYQRAADRGLENDEFRPLIRDAQAIARERLPRAVL